LAISLPFLYATSAALKKSHRVCGSNADRTKRGLAAVSRSFDQDWPGARNDRNARSSNSNRSCRFGAKHDARAKVWLPGALGNCPGGAPCRHCLKTFIAGEDRAILFTYDRFAGIEELPQPGPIYVHAENCTRYTGDAGFPEELRNSPRTLEAYARGRKLITQEYVSDGRFEPAIEKIFQRPEVDYIQVNSTTAGCFTFRIERAQ